LSIKTKRKEEKKRKTNGGKKKPSKCASEATLFAGNLFSSPIPEPAPPLNLNDKVFIKYCQHCFIHSAESSIGLNCLSKRFLLLLLLVLLFHDGFHNILTTLTNMEMRQIDR
jgi:hypothetical protein